MQMTPVFVIGTPNQIYYGSQDIPCGLVNRYPSTVHTEHEARTIIAVKSDMKFVCLGPLTVLMSRWRTVYLRGMTNGPMQGRC